MPTTHVKLVAFLALFAIMASGAAPLRAHAVSAAPVPDPPPFDAWLAEFMEDAAARGISRSTLEGALDGVELIPRVIELDRKQPEYTLTFQQYVTRVAPEGRIRRGREKLARNRALLDFVAEEIPMHGSDEEGSNGLSLDWRLITWGPSPTGDSWVATVALTARGGDGKYIFWAGGEPVTGDQLLVTGKPCESASMTIGVTSGGLVTTDELIILDPDGISITAKGRLLLRNIAMVFDRHLHEVGEGKRFSKAI